MATLIGPLPHCPWASSAADPAIIASATASPRTDLERFLMIVSRPQFDELKIRFGFAFAHASASADAAHLIALPMNWRYAGGAHAVEPCPTCEKKTGLFFAVFTHPARLLYFTFGFRFFVGSAGWKSVRASGCTASSNQWHAYASSVM